MKLELIAIPVSDVDRAKEFYIRDRVHPRSRSPGHTRAALRAAQHGGARRSHREIPERHRRGQDDGMSTYVLIPGACHGAWCFDELAAALRYTATASWPTRSPGSPSGPICCTRASTSRRTSPTSWPHCPWIAMPTTSSSSATAMAAWSSTVLVADLAFPRTRGCAPLSPSTPCWCPAMVESCWDLVNDEESGKW